MPPKTQEGSAELGAAIRSRREELGLTVEQAAGRARIGQKTWTRYESGESIRKDKVRGLCAALGWKTIYDGLQPENTVGDESLYLASIDESQAHWSPYLAAVYGRKAAVTFCLGSTILFDELGMDLEELSTKPRGTHLGEIGISMTLDYLPKQFVTRYDYDFVYRLRSRLTLVRDDLRTCDHFDVHMVADELLLRMVEAEADFMMEYWQGEQGDELSEDWVISICEDDDFSLFLNDETYVEPWQTHHFDHWFEDSLNTSRGLVSPTWARSGEVEA